MVAFVDMNRIMYLCVKWSLQHLFVKIMTELYAEYKDKVAQKELCLLIANSMEDLLNKLESPDWKWSVTFVPNG